MISSRHENYRQRLSSRQHLLDVFSCRVDSAISSSLDLWASDADLDFATSYVLYRYLIEESPKRIGELVCEYLEDLKD
jgi:hypothetical protein